MREFPQFQYSMNEVKRVGEALRGDIAWHETRRAEVLHIFSVANNWIDTHLYPMVRIRHDVVAKVRKLKLAGITASRLKRMSSVRKKLRRLPTKLDQIQDLGGCRAVLRSIADARKLFEFYQTASTHHLHKPTDYIAHPKVGGYRSYHLMLRFRGSGSDVVYDGRRIELQIRTRLQHSWATAVEAVGLFLREDLKASEGEPDWLRLFDLMSSELAMAEDCPEAEHLPGHRDRVAEIIELNRKLNALEVLEALRVAVRHTDWVQSPEPPKYYRIQFNLKTSQVEVQPHHGAIAGVADQHAAEQSDALSGQSTINTVFVEADRIEDLKAAYPNYFGDVEVFRRNLLEVTKGKTAREYTMPPRITVPPPPEKPGDVSWMRGKGRRWSEPPPRRKPPRR
jgi:ppGpp synthetase/RelA/SpoT-type nucleotidyltranferase